MGRRPANQLHPPIRTWQATSRCTTLLKGKWFGSTAHCLKKPGFKNSCLLYKELDADDEELTRTKKIRRAFINEKYVKEIVALYGDVEEIPIEAVIRYQDGKTATLRTNLRIRIMNPHEMEKGELKKRSFWRRFSGRG